MELVSDPGFNIILSLIMLGVTPNIRHCIVNKQVVVDIVFSLSRVHHGVLIGVLANTEHRLAHRGATIYLMILIYYVFV